MSTILVLNWFTALSFLLFGKSCLHKPYMKREFDRYQLANFRVLVGILQLLGGIGLIIGYYYSSILWVFSSLGLAVLMILGTMVRIKIRDSFFQMTPALSYALLCLYILNEGLSMLFSN